MTPQQALDILGLVGTPDLAKIDASHRARVAEADAEIQNAIDEPTKHAWMQRKAALNDAYSALMRQTLGGAEVASNSTSQPTFQPPSGLSATMMADLPGAHPYQTALGTGGNMAQIASLQPGHVLSNRFEIKAQIGAGGMGAVYRAHDRNRGEDIAVKVMLPGLISSDVAKQRFLNEAKIAIKLGHQHIVNTYDVQIDGAYIFITMELLEGTNLRQLMTEKKQQHQQWEEKEVLDIIRPLCEALTYAHRFTIHRDIKPENVWINRDGSIKLMDFGIARLMTDSQMTQTSAVLGTAYYMAPEQLVGAKGVDHRADQYSVGVMVYELLTERIPTGRFKQINEIRDDISQGLSDAVDKALAGHPEDRYENMAAFAQGLEQVGTGRKKKATKKTDIHKTESQQQSGKHRQMKWAGIATAVISIMVGGYFLITTQSQTVWQAEEGNEGSGITMVQIPGKDYEIGKYEVTQAQWKSVMGSSPSHFKKCGENCPVERVSWKDAQVFIQKLNANTGKQYRLPTDEEWVYACYGGKKTSFCGSNNLNEVSWYGGNSNSKTHSVGQKIPNDFGLYDMNGNVNEWIEDCHNGDCSRRVVRGDSWGYDEHSSNTFKRFGMNPSARDEYMGFRLARSLGAKSGATDDISIQKNNYKIGIAPKSSIPSISNVGKTNVVKLNTNHGTITIQLYADKAPNTVINFLAYVNSGYYSNTTFHRVIENFMIQGGGYESGMRQKSVRAPIQNEAANGLTNDAYTVALARASDPHSGTAQFFINVKSNNFLNFTAPTTQGYGYCVFGRVIDGFKVVDAISKVKTGSNGGYKDVPFEDVIITNVEVVH
jgi:serine/threonine protein kinase/cyclophilin family peptidyl-prolyl cis-trans isomerase